jgi:hypothetical protein
MANMQRDEFVTELNARGWSRFTSTQLQKYLDWALQDIYGMARYNRSTLTVTTVSATVLDLIPFATVSAGAAELVHQIKAVFAKYGTDLYPVEAASEDQFINTIYVNRLATNPVKAAYPVLYYVYQLGVHLYPKPQAAVDIIIHSLLREDTFTGGTDVTGLPERFDKAVLAQTEAFCYRRAHDPEGFSFAQATVRDFILDELGLEGMEMEEKADRVTPWRG